MSFSLLVCLSFYLHVHSYLSMNLCFYLSICPSVYLPFQTRFHKETQKRKSSIRNVTWLQNEPTIKSPSAIKLFRKERWRKSSFLNQLNKYCTTSHLMEWLETIESPNRLGFLNSPMKVDNSQLTKEFTANSFLIVKLYKIDLWIGKAFFYFMFSFFFW